VPCMKHKLWNRRETIAAAVAMGIIPGSLIAESVTMLTRPIPASGETLPVIGQVVQQGCIDGFRAPQMIPGKAQFEGNGESVSRAATPYWIIWVAPFGRAVKRSSAVLRLLARTRHYRRDAPSGQPLHNSLNPSNLPYWTTSSGRAYRAVTHCA